MLTYSDRKNVMLWLQEAFLKTEEQGLLSPHLISHMRSALTLEWSDKMSRCIGLAQYNRKRKEASIRLSAILWMAAPEEEKRETVYHEFAHVVVDIERAHKDANRVLTFRRERRSIHGDDWRYVMHKLGYPNAARCHDVVNEAYERAKGKIPVHCSCKADPIAWVSFGKARRLASGATVCRKCRGTFHLGK